MTDPIADLLTRIRNAYKAHKVAVDVPASGIKREIVRILQEKKFVKDMMELPDNKQGLLRVYLLYSAGDVPVLKGIKVRQSTFNQRGMTVVSTSSGVMTNFDAASKGIGGEVLLRCW
jgi:small subunit ribosomal protein S8